MWTGSWAEHILFHQKEMLTSCSNEAWSALTSFVFNKNFLYFHHFFDSVDHVMQHLRLFDVNFMDDDSHFYEPLFICDLHELMGLFTQGVLARFLAPFDGGKDPSEFSLDYSAVSNVM